MRDLLLVSVLSLCMPAVSHADTVFHLVNNTYEGGGVATGTVNIDTVNGVFDSVNIDLTLSGADYLFTGAPATQVAGFDNNTQYYEYSFDAGNDALTIDIPVGSLVGYSGGLLCTDANLCGSGYEGDLQLADGTLYGAATGSLAATPEPSSLILLGSGVLAGVGVVRRRIFSRD